MRTVMAFIVFAFRIHYSVHILFSSLHNTTTPNIFSTVDLIINYTFSLLTHYDIDVSLMLLLDHIRTHAHTLCEVWVYFHLFSLHFVISSQTKKMISALCGIPLPTRTWFLFTPAVRGSRFRPFPFTLFPPLDCITFRFISHKFYRRQFYFILF